MDLGDRIQVQAVSLANPPSTLHKVGELGAHADLFFGWHRGDEFNEFNRSHAPRLCGK
jgi:hypothetical protein